MPKKLYLETEQLAGGCGVQVFNAFSFDEKPFAWLDSRTPEFGTCHAHGNFVGAGLKLACFIDTPECELAYEKLAEKFQIVYQSSVRLNRNSGNDFFMCVYEER